MKSAIHLLGNELEILSDAPSLEGRYQVSNFGRIKNSKTGKIRKNVDNGRGYYKFSVMTRGKNSSFYVHRLVAMCFVTLELGKHCVNHIDGNTFNNHCDNLEWVTQKENVNHAIENGLFYPVDNANKGSSLSYIDIEYIRANYIDGDLLFGKKALSKKFGCTERTISNVVGFKVYKLERE